MDDILIFKTSNKTKKSIYKPLSQLQDEFKYYPKFIPDDYCKDFCKIAESLFPNERSTCVVYGKQHTIPRDQVVMGKEYSYSGHKVTVVEWETEVYYIKELLNDLPEFEEFKLEFDTVLINGYNGKDKVGWHSDDEELLNSEKPIVSVSFGGTRDFDIKLIDDKNQKWRLSLNDGDVVVMMPGVQKKYYHQVPSRMKAKRRYNLTFRMYNKNEI
jgi:alkylated DNA repair dioxygenase AlkB